MKDAYLPQDVLDGCRKAIPQGAKTTNLYRPLGLPSLQPIPMDDADEPSGLFAVERLGVFCESFRRRIRPAPPRGQFSMNAHAWIDEHRPWDTKNSIPVTAEPQR